uniref:DBP5 protein n=1 Tax=Fopius arisanus TaxID=64838 RepID=A0A0C9QRI2_9HYME
MERKRKWDERLESWRCHDHGTTTKIEVSPSEDIPRVKIGEATVEDIGSHADQFLKSYGVIEEIKRTVFISPQIVLSIPRSVMDTLRLPKFEVHQPTQRKL